MGLSAGQQACQMAGLLQTGPAVGWLGRLPELVSCLVTCIAARLAGLASYRGSLGNPAKALSFTVPEDATVYVTLSEEPVLSHFTGRCHTLCDPTRAVQAEQLARYVFSCACDQDRRLVSGYFLN